MLAKAMTRLYMVTEILFSALFVELSIVFVDAYGLVGVTYAFALNYSIYLVAVFLLLKRHITE